MSGLLDSLRINSVRIAAQQDRPHDDADREAGRAPPAETRVLYEVLDDQVRGRSVPHRAPP